MLVPWWGREYQFTEFQIWENVSSHSQIFEGFCVSRFFSESQDLGIHIGETPIVFLAFYFYYTKEVILSWDTALH